MISCPHNPQGTFGPIGMYHCPDCGIMVLAGFPHPTDEQCREQLPDWQPPRFWLTAADVKRLGTVADGLKAWRDIDGGRYSSINHFASMLDSIRKAIHRG